MMRGFLLLSSILIGLLGYFTIACNTKANADVETFIYNVRVIGFTSSTDTLIGAGYAVCNAFAEGASGVDVAEYIYLNTDVSVSARDAALFVITATEQLCPQHDHRNENGTLT